MAASGGAGDVTGGGGAGTGGLDAATGGVPAGVGGESQLGSGGADGTGGGEDPGSGGTGTGGGLNQIDPSTATFIPDPSWDCGSPEGIVPPEMGELVFEVTVATDAPMVMGVTPFGNRRVIGIQGGAFSGDSISGEFLEGGIDFELSLETGTVELEQVAMLRTSDGDFIYLRTCGIGARGDAVVRFIPDFEAPNSSSASWLNTGEFVGTRTFDFATNEMHLAIYDVSSVTPPVEEIVIEDPPAIPNQPWECATNNGSQGAAIFTETVTLGASQSVGESKRGNRNVIPITGGTVTGDFTGIVVPGGADYQILSGGATLDARYTLKSDDGEYLIVRNCGPASGLIPFFEARVDGVYDYLNYGEYKSSAPGGANGGVSITFYETN